MQQYIEGSTLFVLFCTYEIYRTRMLQIVFLVSLESSQGGGVHRLGSMMFAKVLKYWMTFSLKIKLNDSWKFQRNWNVPLVLLERSWWTGFNGIYLVRFGFRMGDILIFKCFLLLKSQINSKNSGFGKKNQLRCGNTWRLYHSIQVKNWYIVKQCSHIEFPYFVMGSHLGQGHRPH